MPCYSTIAIELGKLTNPFSYRNELRSFLETIPSKGSSTRRISLVDLLFYHFGDDWQQLVKKPACRDILAERQIRDELEAAKVELNVLTEVATSSAQAAEDACQSEKRALHQELAASEAAERAQAAKISLDVAKEKAGHALEALRLQEEATQRKKDELERAASDGTKGIVSRNKAKAELSILLSEDPIKLRTARIQQEASVNKMVAAANMAEDTLHHSETALERAAHARKEAIRLKESSLAAAKQAEMAIPSAQAAFNKISQTLDDIMKNQKAGRGTVFFIQSDLNESRKHLPKHRFIVAQKRAEEVFKLAPLSPTRSPTR